MESPTPEIRVASLVDVLDGLELDTADLKDVLREACDKRWERGPNQAKDREGYRNHWDAAALVELAGTFGLPACLELAAEKASQAKRGKHYLSTQMLVHRACREADRHDLIEEFLWPVGGRYEQCIDPIYGTVGTRDIMDEG